MTLLTLTSTSNNANGIVNSTIIFIRPRWLKQCTTLHFWLCNAIYAGVSATWCQQCHQWHHSIWEVKMIKMQQYDISWSCDDTGTSICIMWCQKHHQWHQCIYLVKIIKMSCNIGTSVGITNGTIAFSSWRQLRWSAISFFIIWYKWHWHQSHIMKTASSMAPLLH